MLANTLIAVIVGLVLLLGVCVIVVRGAGHQFPRSYQLLRESPSIARREWIATRGIICVLVVVVLLLLTALF
jgi:uncharacterized membrane protein YdbT with pleckstrin-like domain